MKKICGYDLNGWHDTAIRNWKILPDEEIEFGRFSSTSGLKPVIVKSGNSKSLKWIGGHQAYIAPHGCGDGWGEIGNSNRRKLVLDILENEDSETEELLGAAIAGLSKSADFAVIGIDDLPTTNEFLQEKLINALGKANVRTKLLVWRPVLAVIHQIELGLIEEESSVGVICHSSNGFSIQKLLVKKIKHKAQIILTPERSKPGQLIKSELGYNGLWMKAHNLITDQLNDIRFLDAGLINATPKLAMGFRSKTELLKIRNGNWVKINPPKKIDLADTDLSSDLFGDILDCDYILFETLSKGAVKDFLHKRFSEIIKSEIILLEDGGIAKGAISAAERLSNAQPVYLDFLPQISTIINSKEGAESFDLINDAETVEAGQLYKSRYPATFGIQSGQSKLSIYIRKENERWPRKAIISLGSKVQEPTPIDLSVEQRPASGRAKLLMVSSGLGRNFTIDWDASEVIEKEWDILVKELGDYSTSIPARLVLPNGLDAWNNSMRSNDLYEILHKNVDRKKPDWESLANKLSDRTLKQYCISSDGAVPEKISQSTVEQLDYLTECAIVEMQKRLDGEIKVDNNNSLKFLTWQFRRCPQKVTRWLLDYAQNKNSGITHPFAINSSSDILVFQGLGRVTNSVEAEKEIIELILEKPIEDWKWRIETACLSFLLSRSETAPKILTRGMVEKISKRVVLEFRNALGSEYTTFNYAPLLLVGLLRWRIIAPNALVFGKDKIAMNLKQCIDDTIKDLSSRQKSNSKIKKAHKQYLPILEDILLELNGDGSNPELLFDIYNM